MTVNPILVKLGTFAGIGVGAAAITGLATRAIVNSIDDAGTHDRVGDLTKNIAGAGIMALLFIPGLPSRPYLSIGLAGALLGVFMGANADHRVAAAKAVQPA